jgi:hypothetical protein
MRARLALAAVVGWGVVACSYVVQRLGSAYSGEVDPKLILATEHIPFFWRLGLSVAHGAAAGACAWTFVEEADALRWLDRVAAITVAALALSAAAMVAVP